MEFWKVYKKTQHRLVLIIHHAFKIPKEPLADRIRSIFANNHTFLPLFFEKPMPSNRGSNRGGRGRGRGAPANQLTPTPSRQRAAPPPSATQGFQAHSNDERDHAYEVVNSRLRKEKGALRDENVRLEKEKSAMMDKQTELEERLAALTRELAEQKARQQQHPTQEIQSAEEDEEDPYEEQPSPRTEDDDVTERRIGTFKARAGARIQT